MGALPRQKQWVAVGNTSCPAYLLGRHLNFHSDPALKGCRGWAVDRHSLASPSCYPTNRQQNSPETQLPWTADNVPLPWLWRTAPQDNPTGKASSRLPTRYLSSKPSPSAGQAGTASNFRAAIATLLLAITAAR